MCGTRISTSGCIEHRRDPRKDHENVSTTARLYLHGDVSIKERVLDRTRPLNVKPGRYRPADPLLAFLSGL